MQQSSQTCIGLLTTLIRSKVSRNFKTSSHEPSMPRSVIKRFAAVPLTDFGTLSDESKRILESLGVNWDLAKKKADRLLKKRRIEVDESGSDSESDDEPQIKRKRYR
ncbi:hypothetical protein ElyMa_005716600 [Elysia marginata]|uniref:Uncharacterized protein n=1 Tax=Elysia marginata TaxID=1093978 RepID=A0AAV4FHX8_9GAST|nr:hypothetical protein ElyMa_005716600 [Elysia marginata]